uniref:WIZ zinc finger n=1 Tax=Latimeria chalumnae TaxID=7897 RepID=H3AZ65_LATCH
YVCDVMLDSQGKEDLTPEEEPSVYTCIECSIYFKKKEHLLEHMHQHHQRQRQDQAGETVVGPQCSFMCQECGWAFEDISTLEQHRRLHQESREKIIEEIQKLNEFPDEGREARLQCPKCIFGTNSSKIFVQHAKTHVKEKRDQETRKMFGSPSHERRGSPMLQIYQHFHHNELPTPKHLLKSHYCCRICGFPSPSENVLKEHMKYSHPHLFSEKETFEDSMSLPGTSKDMYGLQSPSRYSEAEFASSSLTRNADKMLLPSSLESVHMFGDSQQRPSLNSGVQRDPKAPELPMTPPSYTSPPKDRRDQQEDHHSQQEAPYPSYFSWISEVDETGEEASSSSDVDVLEESKGLELLEVPPAALEIKRTFRENLREAGSPVTSDEQEHQLRMMVPVVVIETLNVFPKRLKRARYKARMKRKKRSLALEDLSMEEVFSLDQFLAEHPVDDSQEAENALGEDSSSLKNEEKKCPYCSDRFHNGIGLANHIRGHLNRVGVSYNVRHFISAEEVKAIEQKFSFQKKKKKVVANFDPDTFSLMRCEFCGAGFDTRAGLSSHARAHLRDFGITNWEVTISPINILRELLSSKSERPLLPPRETRPPSPSAEHEQTGYTPEGAAMTPKGSMPRSPLSPFASPWGEESVQSYQDALHQTTCEACGISFETRKGLSSHARSHLRQLGVAESESSGAPIDLLNELIKQKGKLEELSETPSKKPAAPKEGAGPPRSLSKPGEPRLLESPVAKQTKTGQNFSPKGLTQAGPQTAKKGPVGGPCSPPHRSFEHEKGSRSPISSPQSPSNLPWTIQQKEEETPLNLTTETEPVKDIPCDFCGEYFENRKGLSSHARSHLRQLGVTEWYVNGSPIDTLREMMKRRSQPRAPSASQGQKTLAKPSMSSVASAESRPTGETPSSTLQKKFGPPVGHVSPGSPTARKMFPGLPSHSLQRKMKVNPTRMEIKREIGSGSFQNNHLTAGSNWPVQDDLSPLNLSTESEGERDVRCDFCGEYFENRKGLSSHARSHLRHLGVTEWSVNGSPIDTLRELLKKKSKPSLIKKEPSASFGNPLKQMQPDRTPPKPSTQVPKSPSKMVPMMSLSPLGGKSMKHNLGGPPMSRSVPVSPIPKSPSGFLSPLLPKRPLQEERSLHSEPRHKHYIQTELPFKPKPSQEKTSTPHSIKAEASCELCGLYFENRKALASHARAHLRQFGVTEWCVNGSPIETLSEWIRRRPQKAGAYRSYVQGGRSFSRKFRSSAHASDRREAAKALSLNLQSGGMPTASKTPTKEPQRGEGGKMAEPMGSAERPAGSPLSPEDAEELQQHSLNKIECRQQRVSEICAAKGDEVGDVRQKMDETRSPPPRIRMVPSLVPKPPQTSLVKFVGNIYTLKCRFCEAEFRGPLSIQEEWVRHLQRHILNTNFPKAAPPQEETTSPEVQGAERELP